MYVKSLRLFAEHWSREHREKTTPSQIFMPCYLSSCRVCPRRINLKHDLINPNFGAIPVATFQMIPDRRCMVNCNTACAQDSMSHDCRYYPVSNHFTRSIWHTLHDLISERPWKLITAWGVLYFFPETFGVCIDGLIWVIAHALSLFDMVWMFDIFDMGIFMWWVTINLFSISAFRNILS